MGLTVESLSCILQTNIKLYINYTLIFKKDGNFMLIQYDLSGMTYYRNLTIIIAYNLNDLNKKYKAKCIWNTTNRNHKERTLQNLINNQQNTDI